MPDQWLNRGWRGSASDRVLIQIFAYAGYKRGVHSRVQSPLLLGSLHVLLLDARLTSSERTSLRLASALRCYESAHPEPYCRRRRRRASLLPGAGTNSPRSRDGIGGTKHPPSSPLTPSINNFPPPFRADIVPEAPFKARSGYTCRRTRGESRTPSREARSRGGITRDDDALREVTTFFFFHWGFV